MRRSRWRVKPTSIALALVLALFSTGFAISLQCHQETEDQTGVSQSVAHDHSHDHGAQAPVAAKSFDIAQEMCAGFAVLLVIALGRKVFGTLKRQGNLQPFNVRRFRAFSPFRIGAPPLLPFSLAAPLRI
jgi:hypothetical protein